jgi:hypothetical protein
MHLGRFHATIYDLDTYFAKISLPSKLRELASSLDGFASNPSENQAQVFKKDFSNFMAVIGRYSDDDLDKPYAQQIIGELGVAGYMPKKLPNRLQKIVVNGGFDHAGIANGLRTFADSAEKKIERILQVDAAFSELDVEFERVVDEEAEIGILLPREIVGNTLATLTAEFSSLNKLFRAVNEITLAGSYDPVVRTISSSWWQIFVELGPAQITAWLLIIEKIVGLFKSNLDIKNLQKQLAEAHNMPDEITDAIEKVIDARLKVSLDELASEIRRDHAKLDDQQRLNELEIMLRHGLVHLAKRISQGAEVEINVSVPKLEDETTLIEGQEVAEDMKEKIKLQQARISELRDLRVRAASVSAMTLNKDSEAQLLLKHFDKDHPDQHD